MPSSLPTAPNWDARFKGGLRLRRPRLRRPRLRRNGSNALRIANEGDKVAATDGDIEELALTRREANLR